MKNPFPILVILLSVGLSAASQNRISSWDASGITEIRIETRYALDSALTLTLTSRPAIDKVMGFLRSIDFREYQAVVQTAEKKKPELWRYKLVFVGQQDEVYLFNRFAFIGKTRYLTDLSVVRDFQVLLEGLE